MVINDVIASMGILDLSNQEFATPKRSGTFTKLPRSEQELLMTLVNYMKTPLTEKRDSVDGIVYAAKGHGSKVGDKRYIKVGYSRNADETRIRAIKKCEIPVEQHFFTPAFKGAWRAEQILQKLFHKDGRERTSCKCKKRNHEWYDKDLGSVRHWVLTIYLWLMKEPYNFDTRLLKKEWQDAILIWENSFETDRPISFEEFIMLGPDLRSTSLLTKSPSLARSPALKAKIQQNLCRPSPKHANSSPTLFADKYVPGAGRSASSSAELRRPNQGDVQAQAHQVDETEKTYGRSAISLRRAKDARKQLHEPRRRDDLDDSQSESDKSDEDEESGDQSGFESDQHYYSAQSEGASAENFQDEDDNEKESDDYERRNSEEGHNVDDADGSRASDSETCPYDSDGAGNINHVRYANDETDINNDIGVTERTGDDEDDNGRACGGRHNDNESEGCAVTTHDKRNGEIDTHGMGSRTRTTPFEAEEIHKSEVALRTLKCLTDGVGRSSSLSTTLDQPTCSTIGSGVARTSYDKLSVSGFSGEPTGCKLKCENQPDRIPPQKEPTNTLVRFDSAEIVEKQHYGSDGGTVELRKSPKVPDLSATAIPLTTVRESAGATCNTSFEMVREVNDRGKLTKAMTNDRQTSLSFSAPDNDRRILFSHSKFLPTMTEGSKSRNTPPEDSNSLWHVAEAATRKNQVLEFERPTDSLQYTFGSSAPTCSSTVFSFRSQQASLGPGRKQQSSTTPAGLINISESAASFKKEHEAADIGGQIALRQALQSYDGTQPAHASGPPKSKNDSQKFFLASPVYLPADDIHPLRQGTSFKSIAECNFGTCTFKAPKPLPSAISNGITSTLEFHSKGSEKPRKDEKLEKSSKWHFEDLPSSHLEGVNKAAISLSIENQQRPPFFSVLDASRSDAISDDPLTSHFMKVWPTKTSEGTLRKTRVHDDNASKTDTKEPSIQQEVGRPVLLLPQMKDAKSIGGAKRS